MRVGGVCAAGKAGWVAVVLQGGRFAGAHVARQLDEWIEELEPTTCIGADIPIGDQPKWVSGRSWRSPSMMTSTFSS